MGKGCRRTLDFPYDTNRIWEPGAPSNSKGGLHVIACPLP